MGVKTYYAMQYKNDWKIIIEQKEQINVPQKPDVLYFILTFQHDFFLKQRIDNQINLR